MDSRNIDLLDQLIADHLDRLTRQLPPAGDGSGKEAVRLIGRLIERFQMERSSIMDDLARAEPDETPVLARKLERLFVDLKTFQPHLTRFAKDASTQPGHLGLHVVVENLVSTLLPNGADPVIHLEERHLYATMDLARSLRLLWNQLPSAADADALWEWDSGPPVVFFVPDLDPDNAMYLPILAHEVGHQAISQADLGNAVMAACAGELQPLFETALASDSELQSRVLRQQLRGWVDEMICDALATAICGPGFLFASVTFLPVSSVGTADSTHPFPHERVRLALDLLRQLGWDEVLMTETPNVVSWLDSVCVRRGAVTPKETFLLEALDVLAPHIRTVALEHLDGACLDPEEFSLLNVEVQKLLDKGVPPAQVGGKSVSHWHIVAAAWLLRIADGGDTPRAVAQGPTNDLTNGRVLTAIELSRILQLWEEEESVDART